MQRNATEKWYKMFEIKKIFVKRLLTFLLSFINTTYNIIASPKPISVNNSASDSDSNGQAYDLSTDGHVQP